MADCLVCLLDYVKEAGKSIVTEAVCPPIKRNVGYWWFFEDNIQGVKDEVHHLEREESNMDQKIKEAQLHAESATPEVKNWLDEVKKKLEEGRRILQSCNELKPWNIIPRYLLGKSAKKTAEGIAKLRNEGNSVTISYPAPPPSMGSISHEPIMEFESRRRIEEDIMESLNDDHVRMIAICGAGGVGKTTMVRRIEDRVREEKLFDEVVHVVVSQPIDILKIQKEIAELLRLDFNEDTLAGRAHKLHTRLMDSKRKLIIFDDVWKRFNLMDLGVPFENAFVRCKIILTSRVKDACKKMNAKIIPMEVLTKKEAWTLFKEKAGSYVEGLDLRPIAEDVAEECKHLPLALVIVGEALKDQSIPVWRDSLSQLKNPIDFTELIDDVYKPLKLSYDFLENESVKSLFLLCCLFPEDYDIPIELLTLISIGLGMHEGIRKIEEGRNRTYSFVEKLKSCFLLLDGGRGHYIQMHDVVRNVAIFIGSKEKHGFLKSLAVSSMDSSSKYSSHNCNWMSIDISIENSMLPAGPDYPNLRLLMILSSRFSEVFDANVIYFEGMEELKVLSFSRINLGSLPPTLELLKKLRTLHLKSCAVRDISVVGELTSLEILCIYYCHNIEELPADIGRLNRLRLLELIYCRHLKRVVAGIISSLVLLEELKIIYCFDKWEVKGNQSEERNATLSELETLHNLTCLEIDIFDSNLVAQEICLSQHLVRYQIRFTEAEYGFGRIKCERKISFNLRGDITTGNWIHQLVRSTQSLILSGDGSNCINLAEIECLKKLMLTECSTLKKIDCKFHVLEQLYLRDLIEVESIVDDTIPEGSNFFQKLKLLEVMDLPKLEHLWRSPNQNVSLANLKRIIIHDCPNLRSLFSLETVRSLVQLQLLEIERCDMIEQMFWNEIESNLGDEIIEFHQLTELKITDCPKLRTKFGKCPNLRTIQLYTFHGLHHLLSSCCTRTWNTQLHKLSVSDCDTVEELLVDEIEDEGNRHIIFPELEELELRDLPCLTTFYRGVETIKFPKLERIEILNLPRLNKLAPMDSEPSHDDHSLHFFCNQKDTISKIWCRLVPNNFFHKLKWLYISNVNGIRNLMSYSIAGNLVNLERLSIKRCQEVIEVVEDDKEIYVMSLFPKLMYIKISNLQKLKSFCRCTHALEFPSLSSVAIVHCPGMETFTLGSIKTPYSFRLWINYERYEEKDLNDSIRDHFMTKDEMTARITEASQAATEGGEPHIPSLDDINNIYYEAAGGMKKSRHYGLGSQEKVMFPHPMSTSRGRGCPSSSSAEIKELRAENDELRARVATLVESRAENAELKARMAALEGSMHAFMSHMLSQPLATSSSFPDFSSPIIDSDET